MLGCAKADRLLLPPMLQGLVTAGFEVEVASGLELRPDSLMAAATRMPDAAYVLLESLELPTTGIGQLRARLLAAGIPARRLIVLAIEQAAGTIDVTARLAAAGMVASPVRRPTSVRLQAVAGDPIATVQVAVGNTVVGFPAPGVVVAPALPGVQRTMHAPVSASVPVLDMEIEEMFAPRRRWIAVGVGAAVVAIGLIALAGRDEPEPLSQAEIARTIAAWSDIVDDVLPSVAKEPIDAELVVAAVAFVPPAPVAIVAVPPPVLPVVVATPDLPPPVAAAPVLPVTPAAVVVVAEEPTIVEPMVDEVEIQSIYAGLVSQKFRALDILLVSPEPRKRKGKRIFKTPGKMSWVAATSYCDALEIGGVGDWRLPQVGELGSLTSGELLPDAKFWSETQGDTFGRSRVVWNTKTARMGTAPVRWTGGRVVCVRTLAKAPELPVEPKP